MESRNMVARSAISEGPGCRIGSAGIRGRAAGRRSSGVWLDGWRTIVLPLQMPLPLPLKVENASPTPRTHHHGHRPAASGGLGPPFQMPARLADGLGLGSAPGMQTGLPNGRCALHRTPRSAGSGTCGNWVPRVRRWKTPDFGCDGEYATKSSGRQITDESPEASSARIVPAFRGGKAAPDR